MKNSSDHLIVQKKSTKEEQNLERNISQPLNTIILLLKADNLPKTINSNLECAVSSQVWQLTLIRIISYSLFQFLIAASFSPKFIDSLHKYTCNFARRSCCNVSGSFSSTTLKIMVHMLSMPNRNFNLSTN